MKRYYEIVVIFRPTVSEEKLGKDIRKIKDIITSCDGEVVKEEHWGSKTLAYEIKKCTSGIYHFILCSIGKFSFVEELKKFFATNEDIIRYGIKKVEKEKLDKKQANKTSKEEVQHLTI